MIADPELSGAALLLGTEAHSVLAAALEAAGERLHTSRPSQVRYRPGRSITVTYRAELDRRPGGMPSIATLVAMAGGDLPEGALTLEGGGITVGVWRYPNDPLLPGLRHVVDAGRRAALLADLGLDADVSGLRTRSYRPTRRAVVELTTTAGRWFAKVVRPGKLAPLVRNYEAAADAGIAPPLLALAPEHGLIVTREVGGAVMRDRLGSGPALPGPDALTGLLDRLPDAPRRVAGPVERLDDHARLLAAISPNVAPLLAGLAEEAATAPAGEQVPVHGDFHPGQVAIRDGDAVALLDVDTLGTGRREHDLATMLGYLHAREADGDQTVAPYRERLQAAFDAPGLRIVTAAAVAGFATMPFVAQQPDWPAGVERRVRRAVTLAAAG